MTTNQLEQTRSLVNTVGESLDKSMKWLLFEQPEYILVAIFITGVLMFLAFKKQVWFRKKQEPLAWKARKLYINNYVQELVTEALEKKVEEGDFLRVEVDKVYKSLNRVLGERSSLFKGMLARKGKGEAEEGGAEKKTRISKKDRLASIFKK